MSRGSEISTTIVDEESEELGLSRVRAARRRHILDSALKTFLRDGYHGATMERVAEDAEVSKQTLYNYFVDKETLFVSLIEERKAERILPALEPALQAIAQGDLETGLRAVAETALCPKEDAEQAAFFRLALETATELPELTQRVRDGIRDRVCLPTIDRIREALAHGIDSGRLRPVDAEVAARIVFGTMTACSHLQPFLYPEPVGAAAPERVASGFADLLSHGLLRA